MAHHQGDVRDSSNALYGNNRFEGQVHFGGHIVNNNYHYPFIPGSSGLAFQQPLESNDDEGNSSSGDKHDFLSEFDRIYEQHPSAAQLLSLVGMFHPRSIPRSLLLDPTSSTSRVTRQEVERKFERDSEVLLDCSVVRLDTDGSGLSMDDFAHHCVKEWLSEDQVRFFKSRSWSALASNIPDPNAGNLERFESLLPHIEIVAMEDPRLVDAQSAVVWTTILRRGAWYAHRTGRYPMAEQMSRKALGVSKEMFGVHHYKTIRFRSQLARAYARQMNYPAAEKIQSRVVHHQRKTYGAKDRRVLLDSSELATTLYHMNDPRAKAIYREILPGLEGILRDNNLSPTDTRNINAAISETLHGLQKWNKCETMDRQILARTLEALSRYDLTSLNAMDRLGLTLQRRNKHQEAENLFRASIKGRTEKLGDCHIDTLNSILHLADTLAAQHEFREAKLLYKEALDGFGEWVEPQHEIIRRCYKSFQVCSDMVQDDVERPRARSSSGESQESASSSDDGQYASSSDGYQAHKQGEQHIDRKRGVFKWFRRG
ncbi:hypothetical protein D6D28_00658 [Aureobasidium pullulans]|uniref:TPR-like protein n=1 Tax=Aureobasidium pullulans TaxID=5580 RepID=A0A4V4I1K9_AURPU|nr:hypothetical protein D6D28_00658 [Aureobasidium pullulans]